MKRIFLIFFILLFTTGAQAQEEITMPDFMEAVQTANTKRISPTKVEVSVPGKPAFNKPFESLINMEILIPTNRGLILKNGTSEQQITSALVRHGLSVASEVSKIHQLREDVDQITETVQVNSEQISEVAWWIDILKIAGILGFIAFFMSTFNAANTLHNVRSRQGHGKPPFQKPKPIQQPVKAKTVNKSPRRKK